MYRLPIRTLPFVLLFAAAPTRALAGQFRSIEDLTRQSRLIVVGHVAAADSYVGDDGEVYTTVSLSAESVLKGETGVDAELRFTVKGGVIGDRVVYFSDAPRFTTGEDVVVFGESSEGLTEKLTLDVFGGPDVLLRIEGAREDAGEAVPRDQLQRARQFLRDADDRTRERPGGLIELNAVSCSAYMGPKWALPAATYSLSTALPTTWPAALTAAVQSWATAGSRFAFSPSAASPHLVSLGDLGAGPTLASTRVEYYQSSLQLVRFTLTFNSRYPWSTTGEAGKFDVQSIATHEFGHALGLNHPSDATCAQETMWASAAAGETKKRSLEAGDKAGTITLYGAASAGTTPATAPPPPAAPIVSAFALVTPRAVATKPVVILLQGTGFDPMKLQGVFTGGGCGAAGCAGTPYAASDINTVFINTLPAGTYSLAIRNGATGTLSAPRQFIVNAN